MNMQGESEEREREKIWLGFELKAMALAVTPLAKLY